MATNNIVPILHHGLAGKFTRADGLQSQNVAGIQYGKLQWPAGSPLRMAAGRLDFEMLAGDGSEFNARIDLATMTLAAALEPGKSWSGGYDLDDGQAPFGSISDLFANVLGYEVHCVVTARGAEVGDGTIALTANIRTLPSQNQQTVCNLVQAGTATPNPSADAPWWAVVMLGNNTSLALPSQGMMTGEGVPDGLFLDIDALAGTGFTGYIEVVMVVKGS